MRLVTAQFSSTAQEELGIRSVFYGPVKAHYSFLSSRSAATGAVNGCRCEAAEVVKASVVKKKKDVRRRRKRARERKAGIWEGPESDGTCAPPFLSHLYWTVPKSYIFNKARGILHSAWYLLLIWPVFYNKSCFFPSPSHSSCRRITLSNL